MSTVQYLPDSKVLGNSVGGLRAKFAEYFPILLNLASSSFFSTRARCTIASLG